MLNEDRAHSVRRLLDPVSSTVRAASIFPSLSRVVEELVLNSLDASSSVIEVQLDLRTFSTEVIDNGKLAKIGTPTMDTVKLIGTYGILDSIAVMQGLE